MNGFLNFDSRAECLHALNIGANGQVYEPCLYGTIELQRLLIGMAYTPC